MDDVASPGRAAAGDSLSTALDLPAALRLNTPCAVVDDCMAEHLAALQLLRDMRGANDGEADAAADDAADAAAAADEAAQMQVRSAHTPAELQISTALLSRCSVTMS